MTGPRLAALSLVLVAALHGLTSGRWPGSAAAALSLAAAALVRRRLVLGSFAQIVLTLAAAAAGGALAWIEAPEQPPLTLLGRGWSVMAVSALFAASLRAWIRAPEGGFFATFVLGLVALVGAGETPTSGVYPVFVIGYILCGFAALRAHDGGRPALSALPARGWAAAAAMIGVAAAVTVGLAAVLPPLGVKAKDRLLASIGAPVTGLGERMVLGSMEGMLQSDEIVARVYGPPVDYLRGVVYDHYQAGQWAASTTEGTRPVRTPAPPPAGPRRVRVVLAGASRTDRYLLPLGATAVSIRDGEVLADRFGTLRPARGSPKAIELDLPEALPGEPAPPDGAPPPGDFPPADPSQDDLRRPVKLNREITPLVRAWIADATTPEERVEAIARHLRSELSYSLNVARGRGDPLLDFLTKNRAGHCEYFASAMAVLARVAGVPARVVAGYRVTERNDLGGYSIVRKRDAHAWVEVHIAGKGWKTVDATPEDPLARDRPRATPFFTALLDLAAAALQSARERAEAPSLPQIIVALLFVVAAGLAARWWGQRRRRRAEGPEPFFTTAPPPPALVRLEEALAARGQSREPSEPIERFAARLGESGSAGSAAVGEARELLSRYAALRYGGVGDAAALLAEMDACAARLSSG